jgi:protein TonB
MFDKLIVSEPEGANFKTRRSYFVVSSLVVGVFFVTAVVISIFASDYRLGTDSFELVEMIAPVEMTRVEPEPPRIQPRTPSAAVSSSTNVLPQRKISMANITESPKDVPPLSVKPNSEVSRPSGQYEIGPQNTNPSVGSGRESDETGTGVGPTGLVASASVVKDTPALPEPPPVRETPVVRPPVTKSMGVINGMATSLPKPNYPAAARAVRVEGKVDVQVLIDETGKVVSAKAVSGNALLREAAVAAARNARFTPTLLSKVPVKVTGVIVYNFSRG